QARRAGTSCAGRARPGGRGAASRLRDPRDRPRPALAALHSSRIDPGAARVARVAGVTGAPIAALAGIRPERAPDFVLDVPALTIEARQVLAVIGPNGSGKSTLLRVIGLLESPDQGEVSVHGRIVSVATGLTERRTMATVFQVPLLTDTTVVANVGLGLRFRGGPAAEQNMRIMRWLDRFRIAHLAERQARTLSAGEAHRAAPAPPPG